MTRALAVSTLLMSLALAGGVHPAQSEAARKELRQVMDDFVRGWREGDAALLSRIVDLDEGRITWVTGEGNQ